MLDPQFQGQGLHDGQAQSGVPAALAGVGRLEQARQFFRGDAAAVVADRDQYLPGAAQIDAGVGLDRHLALFVAEHGVWIKRTAGDWELTVPLSSEWKQQALPLFTMYADIVPGSFVEAKEFSIAWHYRKADPEQGSSRARELIGEIDEFTSNVNVHVVHGNKVVELRSAGVDKGTAAQYLLDGKDYDFILAAGDDRTDEDLFKAIPEDVYSIKVGYCSAHAR